MKLIFIAIPILFSCGANYEKASPIDVGNIDSALFQYDSLAGKYTQDIAQIDSATQVVEEAIKKINQLEKDKREYEKGIRVLAYVPNNDSANKLRLKLNEANRQIAKLTSELNSLKTKETVTKYQPVVRKPDTVFIQPGIITPDETSLVVNLDGKIPDNVTLYLIPYSKRIKKLMVYEASCDESIILKNDFKTAKYYNGLYFFNSVPPGKYLIKICTYYGNYKLITKSQGKDIVKMEVAPPIQ